MIQQQHDLGVSRVRRDVQRPALHVQLVQVLRHHTIRVLSPPLPVALKNPSIRFFSYKAPDQ